MTEAVFLDYDQERLDALLDVRRRVPDHEAYVERFEARSADVGSGPGARIDLRYGSHERERLDLFLPPAATGPVPVNVFFHGGYWRSGDKERYSYIAEAFTPAGAACAVIEYALVPTVSLDELIRQCRAALAHIYREAGSLGVDATRIHISGHSAGGQIVGMLMADGWQQPLGLPAEVVRSGCGISGLYDMQPIRLSYLNATLGLDHDTARRNSPSLLRPATSAPLILAVGALEGDEFLRQSAIMEAAWAGDVAITPMILNGGHHYSAVEALGDPDSELARAVLAQMHLA